jgi:hypothetical protein
VQGAFTQIDFPDVKNTRLFGINPQGDIVGEFDDEDDVPHGLLRTRDGMVSLDFPDGTGTFAFRINAQGDVVGSYLDADGNTHGFLRRATGSMRRTRSRLKLAIYVSVSRRPPWPSASLSSRAIARDPELGRLGAGKVAGIRLVQGRDPSLRSG